MKELQIHIFLLHAIKHTLLTLVMNYNWAKTSSSHNSITQKILTLETQLKLKLSDNTWHAGTHSRLQLWLFPWTSHHSLIEVKRYNTTEGQASPRVTSPPSVLTPFNCLLYTLQTLEEMNWPGSDDGWVWSISGNDNSWYWCRPRLLKKD